MCKKNDTLLSMAFVLFFLLFLCTGNTMVLAQVSTPSPTPVPAVTCQPCIFNASGYVRSSTTNAGISGASITAVGSMGTRSTTTDSTGYYSLNVANCMSGDNVDFTITAPGYEDLITGRGVLCSSTIDFLMDPVTQETTPDPTPVNTPGKTCAPCIFEASGYVRSSTTNLGISGASLTGVADLGTTNTTTDSTGFYRLRVYNCMPGDIVDFTITAPGYADLITSLGVQCSSTIDFLMDPISQDSAGDVWFVPEHKTHTMLDLTYFGDTIPIDPSLIPIAIIGPYTFTNEVLINSGNQVLGEYEFTITFDSSVAVINTNEGTNGVTAGADGFVSAVHTETTGELSVSGFDATGKGPGSTLHVLTIHWLARSYSGTTTLHIGVTTLTDTSSNSIGAPRGHDGSIEIVTVSCTLTGDVDNSGRIDIVDALMLAQYYVGLNPPGIDLVCGDVNHSGTINIVDALLIAQYYVGLISSFP
ncbi:MAG: carboxypeptidase regulatory-like domain-containing protein [Spirochaetales bacterium]|nr:carboxypeptidase regulatory-like domain-containing protein [Spirochaetales bacterium]